MPVNWHREAVSDFVQIGIDLFLSDWTLWLVIGPDATATLMVGLLSLWLLFALSVLLRTARAALLLAVIGGATLLLTVLAAQLPITLASVLLSGTGGVLLDLLVAQLVLVH
jgi:hypothetical protein